MSVGHIAIGDPEAHKVLLLLHFISLLEVCGFAEKRHFVGECVMVLGLIFIGLEDIDGVEEHPRRIVENALVSQR